MLHKFNMTDWQAFSELRPDGVTTAPWRVNNQSAENKIEIDATHPAGHVLCLWIEISGDDLVVHAYDAENDEPVNIRIGKRFIKVECEDRDDAAGNDATLVTRGS